VRVTLLQVNDVYRFTPADRGARGGLARVSTLRKQIMKESPNTLFLLAGDTISPSVESITYKGAQMIDAWNQIGLDYSVFGNHEFDYGDDVLLEAHEGVEVQVARRQRRRLEDGQDLRRDAALRRARVRRRQGRHLRHHAARDEDDLEARPGRPSSATPARRPNKSSRRCARPGAKAVVALTHLSLAQDKALARCAPGIDVIIGGHEHTLLQSSSGGTPIFKMTADARELGRIDLNIDPATGKVESIDWEIIPVNVRPSRTTRRSRPSSRSTRKLTKDLDAPVGRTEVPLDARSATSRTEETNIADFIADSFRRAAGSDVALINGGSIRADDVLPAGDLTVRDVLSILPFGNDLAVIEVTGDVLLQALEHGVSLDGAGRGAGPLRAGLGDSLLVRRVEARGRARLRRDRERQAARPEEDLHARHDELRRGRRRPVRDVQGAARTSP
jgi:5'-nucleotidase